MEILFVFLLLIGALTVEGASADREPSPQPPPVIEEAQAVRPERPREPPCRYGNGSVVYRDLTRPYAAGQMVNNQRTGDEHGCPAE